MRVCMLTTFFPPHHFGGDAIHVHQLSRALAARGHEVDVVYNADAYRLLSRGRSAGDFPECTGVRVHALTSSPAVLEPLLMQQTGRPFRHRAQLEEILRGSALGSGAHYDVIHFHNVSLMGAPGVLGMGGGPRTLRLYTLHEHWLVCPMHVLWRYGREVCEKRTCLRCQLRGGRPPQWWRYSGLLERQLAKIDAFIAPSQFTARKHRELGPELPMRNVRHIPHFTPDVADRSAPDDSTTPFFLFAGRLESEKGAESLLRAFRRYRGAELWLAGDGSQRAALEAQARDLPHVRFLGRLTPADLTDYYARAIGVIVPSLCYEVFGLTAVEAFAAGTPAIVRDRGSLPELVAGTGGGFSYQSEDELIDAMERLRTEPGLRDRLGLAARRAQRSQMSTQPYLDAYESLVAELSAERPAGEGGA